MRNFKISLRKLFLYIMLTCFVLAGIVSLWKTDRVYSEVKKVKESIHRGLEYRTMHTEIADISELPALSDEDDAWYTKYHFIAHGSGG